MSVDGPLGHGGCPKRVLAALFVLGIAAGSVPVFAGAPADPTIASEAAPRLIVHAPAQLRWRAEADLRLREYLLESPGATDDEQAGIVTLSQRSDLSWDLELDLPDGRGFSKRVSIESENPARDLMSALENLLSVAGFASRLEEPQPEGPEEEEVEVPAETETRPELEHEAEPDPPLEALAPPFVSPWIAGGGIFAFNAQNGFRAGGGEFGADLLLARGLSVRTGLRISGSSPSAFSLTRVRWGFGAGYTLRRGNFELPIIAMAHVEGMRIRVDNKKTGIAEEPTFSRGGFKVYVLSERAEAEGLSPLVGGALSVEPRLRFVLDRGPLDAVFVGVRIEAALSGLPPDMDTFVLISELGRDKGVSVAAGGFELGALLVSGLSFGRRPKASNSKRAGASAR